MTSDVRDTLTASSGEPPDVDAAQASFHVWARALTEHIEPAITEAFGEAFRANARTADLTPVHYQEAHMATVHDRLVIWPEGAFEELRPELLEAIAEGESMEQIEERIGRVLNIDAPARRIRADIGVIDKQLADPDTPRSELPGLRGRRRQLWQQHDERNEEWQWKARRIARTEVQGAMNAGTLAAAQAAEDITGDRMFKAWLATSDERTRHTHAVADGQMVRLAEPFTVGGFPLQHPADPFGPAHETINCRCTMRILTDTETQSELQGQWGGRGVGPMNARLGPDDDAEVADAVDRVKREMADEVVDLDDVPETRATPEPPVPDAAEPEPEDDPTPEPAPLSVEEVAEQLDETFADAAEDASPEQQQAVQRWLRAPAAVQGEAIEWGTDSPEQSDEPSDVELLEELMTPLPATVDTAVAVPDVLPVLGVPTADLPALTDSQVTVPGFLPTNLTAAPPIRVPTTSGGGAIHLRVHAPTGTPALWLPTFGGDDNDLLLPVGTVLAIGAVTYAQGQVPVVEATVMPPEESPEPSM
ncbi:phage minor head protein [Rhodococcoides trifolii]|nr:phage minor head protein [Rhodococcus trifolii]